MRTVKIVRGAYGHHRKGSTLTETKTPTDDPFDVSDAEAARLVKLGVAKVVQPAEPSEEDADGTLTDEDGGESVKSGVATAAGGESGTGEGDNPPEEENGAEGEESGRAKPEYNSDMKVDDLKDLLKAAGLPVKTVMAKADIIAMLDAFYADPEDDSELPDLGASEPVS